MLVTSIKNMPPDTLASLKFMWENLNAGIVTTYEEDVATDAFYYSLFTANFAMNDRLRKIVACEIG